MCVRLYGENSRENLFGNYKELQCILAEEDEVFIHTIQTK